MVTLKERRNNPFQTLKRTMSLDPSTRPGEPLYYTPQEYSTVHNREQGFVNKTNSNYKEIHEQDSGDPTRKKSVEDLPTWGDFTQSTTFHGVRYIFQRNHFKVRRWESLLKFLYGKVLYGHSSFVTMKFNVLLWSRVHGVLFVKKLRTFSAKPSAYTHRQRECRVLCLKIDKGW